MPSISAASSRFGARLAYVCPNQDRLSETERKQVLADITRLVVESTKVPTGMAVYRAKDGDSFILLDDDEHPHATEYRKASRALAEKLFPGVDWERFRRDAEAQKHPDYRAGMEALKAKASQIPPAGTIVAHVAKVLGHLQPPRFRSHPSDARSLAS